MSDAAWDCEDSFGIDAGELDGLRPQDCFVLGVEWMMVRLSLDAEDGRGFARPVHSENRDRLVALLARRGRDYRLGYMADDRSESWMWLEVTPR